MMQNNKPSITDKQTDILLLLYKFRFLNRIQIQTLLNHKKFNRVITWLNDLTEEKFIVRDFNKIIGAKPAVYYLGLKARDELLKRDDVRSTLLKRVYQERKVSEVFRNHCMVIADIYLSLLKLTITHKANLSFLTKTDLTGIRYLVLPHPDAFFSIEQETIKKRYFLDIFDEHVSGKWLYKRVHQYFHYYEENYWQDHNPSHFPEIVFVCCDNKTKKDLEKIIRKNLDDQEDLVFSITTLDEIKSKGLIREVLHRVE